MKQTLTSARKFIVVAFPALIAFNTLQAHATHHNNTAASIKVQVAGGGKLSAYRAAGLHTIAQSQTPAHLDSSASKSPDADRFLAIDDVQLSGNDQVAIHWTARNASASSRFEIERSEDGQNFHMVGIFFTSDDAVFAANKFSFTDQSDLLSQPTVAYYRVKRVDANGKAITSEVKELSL